jgi:hypothetical protein
MYLIAPGGARVNPLIPIFISAGARQDHTPRRDGQTISQRSNLVKRSNQSTVNQLPPTLSSSAFLSSAALSNIASATSGAELDLGMGMMTTYLGRARGKRRGEEDWRA